MFLVTGGAGFLGSEVVRQLLNKGAHVRVLVLPGDPLARYLPQEAELVEGDLLNQEDLARFFALPQGQIATVIHCVSLITMSMTPVSKVHQVNVEGTAAIIAACRKGGHRLIHVGSVHAISELPHGQTMAEPALVDPEKVVGYYAKTKAEGVNLVRRAREEGLDANVVYPAGLCGPGDYAHGNLTQLMLDYMKGSITAGVKGGYNFADVRDVAGAIVTLAQTPRPGQDYVLSGEYISIMDILGIFQQITGGRKIRTAVPLWLARASLPLMGLVYKIRKVKPVFSAYSLYTVSANSLFDSSKARQDLGFNPRPIRETLKDTARWLENQEKIK